MARARPIVGVTPDMPVGDFASRAIAVRAEEAQALLAREGGDPDLVHDRRVAIRRLRTALEVFRPLLPKKAAKRARRELKALFSSFGPRRDADVAIVLLRSMEPSLAAEDLPGYRSLIAELDEAGGDGMHAGRVPGLPEPGPNGKPAAAAMEKIAAKRLAAVRKRLGADDPDELHDLRIAAKRLRYVLEVGRPGLGADHQPREAAARSIQEILGDIHDCDVLLPRIAARPGLGGIETLVRARRSELHAALTEERENWQAALG